MSESHRPEAAGMGTRLAEFRRHLGLTQEQAALKYGVGLRTWNRYESNNRRIDSDLILLLAVDGLNTNWLLLNEGNMLVDEIKENTVTYHSKEGALSREEEAVVGLFRGLTKSDRAHAKAVINALASKNMKKDKTSDEIDDDK